MDAKQIKVALKAARESIRTKDFAHAVAQCKEIIESDPENYNALVFLGVASEGSDQIKQALEAYKKAVTCDPKQPLAWQGLCGFYEKNLKVEYMLDLVKVYEKLIEFAKSDANKVRDLTKKLAQTQADLGNSKEAITCYDKAFTLCDGNKELEIDIKKKIIGTLSDLKTPSHEEKVQLGEEYGYLIHDYHDLLAEEENLNFSKKLIDLLLELNQVENAKKECHCFTEWFPDDCFAFEKLGFISLDQVCSGECDGNRLEDLNHKVKELAAESAFLKLLEGHTAVRDKSHYSTGLQSLLQVVNEAPKMMTGLVFLAQLQICIHQLNNAYETLKKACKLLKDKKCIFYGDKTKMEAQINKFLVQTLAGLETPLAAEEALTIGQNMPETQDDVVFRSLVHAYVTLENIEEAKKIVGKISDTNTADFLRGKCHLKEANLQEARTCLERALQGCPNTSEWMTELGKVFWELGKQDVEQFPTALKTFLKAAKLDPYNSVNFAYLGHYYKEVAQDLNKARRCFQKAFELNSSDEEAGAGLVDTLVTLGEEETATNLLLQISGEAPVGSCKWAWLRLGVQQLKLSHGSQAITSLQKAIAAGPKDKHIWECLGDAYLGEGSYTAAMKSFARAIELDDDLALYSHFQIATIKQTLGTFTEAVEDYSEILVKSPKYVPALKGLGETYLSLARQSLQQAFYARAVGQSQNAIKYLTSAASVRQDLSCLWKLLGDCCTILRDLPDELVKMKIPQRLMNASEKSMELVAVGKSDILSLGGRCYGMAIKQLPDCPDLWHDLGVNYFYQARHKPDAQKMLVTKACQCLQKALSLAPTSYKHWNVLGVINSSDVVSNPALAQHCFIKSIENDKNNVVAWTNLGTLYLKNDNVMAANKAFQRAQAIDPTYVAAWVGQAMIAEIIGNREAMDLFRHTTELGPQVQSGVGYAHWVCKILQDHSHLSQNVYEYCIEQMSAIPAASDALAKYTVQVRDDPTAYNMYGILLEKQKLYVTALDAFAKAVKILEEKGGQDDLKQMAKVNYARVLSQLNQGAAGIEQLQSVMQNTKNPAEIATLALAHYKAGHYQESCQLYEQAINLTTEQGDISHLYAAMGMVAAKAGDYETAKQALFKCTQTEPPSVYGLKALFSMGLIQKDHTLATAVLQELDKLQDHEEHAADVAYLTALLLALQEKYQEGRAVLLKAIHKSPGRGALWQTLAEYLLKHQEENSDLATHCSRVGQHLQANNKENAAIFSLSAQTAGLHKAKVPEKNSFRLAQKAVFSHPDDLCNWYGLVSAVYAQHLINSNLGVGKDLSHILLSLTTKMMSKVEAELMRGDAQYLRVLHVWCVKQYVLALLSVGKVTQASEFVQQAFWTYDRDLDLKMLSAAFEKKFKYIKEPGKKADRPASWQIAVNLYISNAMFTEAEEALKLALSYSNSPGTQKIYLMEIAHLAYGRIMEGDEAAETKWKLVFREATSELQTLASHPSAIYLMQGAIALKEKNHKLAKKSFQRVSEHQVKPELGWANNEARRRLLDFYLGKQDQDSIKALLDEAIAEENQEFMQYYRENVKDT